MSNSFFEIFKNDESELFKLGYEIESNIYLSTKEVIEKAKKFIDIIIDKILMEEKNEENLDVILKLVTAEKINTVFNEKNEDNEVLNDFIFINNIKDRNNIEDSIKVHKKLYNITKWYVLNYKNISIDSLNYNLVEIPEGINIDKLSIEQKNRINRFIDKYRKINLSKKIGIEKNNIGKSKDEIFMEKMAMKILGYQYVDEIFEEEAEETKAELIVKSNRDKNLEYKDNEYILKKQNGSYLLNELSKLSYSSKEAVESYKELDTFKKYIHINRSIQEEFVSLIKESNNDNSSQLILLCGSVGDGKSHLLAYVNEEHHEIVKNFNIHNDATESFDPLLTEIETLEKVLVNFKDENIDKNDEKLILAINLGVLNNFLENDKKKKEFTKLIKFISDSEIFNQSKVSKSFVSNHFKMVSFGDYKLYELTEEGPSSRYIKGILDKIVLQDKNNPFYLAYKMDKEEIGTNPVILNYQLLFNEELRKSISQIIIKTIVKNKKILGTRELLNFIYEIIVPANISDFDISLSNTQYLDYLLSNLIFENYDRGELLNLISKEDPLNNRSEQIDNIIIDLNISSDIKKVLKTKFYDSSEWIIDFILYDIENLFKESEDNKEKIINSFIRMIFLFGKKELRDLFISESYRKFMNYLYFYNKGEIKGYKNLFNEIEEAIFNWNGKSGINDYIYIHEKISGCKLLEYLKLKKDKFGMITDKNNEEAIERFKNNILISFKVEGNNKINTLEVDYILYSKIYKLINGYYPNINDREDSLRFVEFIDDIIRCGNMNEEIMIEKQNQDIKFLLKFEDDFEEEFIFERI